MRRRLTFALLVALAASPASAASASTTFGATLSTGNAGTTIMCSAFPFSAGASSSGCTGVVTRQDDGSSAKAPVGGVLVSFAIRMDTAMTGHLRVLHDPSGTGDNVGVDDAMTYASTGPDVSVPGDSAQHSYAVRLPIAAGDYIGFGPTGASAGVTVYRSASGSGGSGERIYQDSADGTQPGEAQLSTAQNAAIQGPLAGTIEPDADGDGFGDQSQDQCPAQAGSSNGCPPDSDGDGVPDASDACPTQSDASAPRNPRTGCPAGAPATDTDSDGIPDSSDECPTQSDLFTQRNPRNGCPAPPLDKTAPVLSSFALSPTSFVAANSGPAVGSAAAVGSHVFYKLSEAATTTFTVERKGTGHKKNGKCVSGRAKHGQKACTLYTRVKGKIVRATGAGLSSFRFMGRLNGRSLKPASYRLVASARDGAGNTSKTIRRSFTIKHA
jgi:hypothetical protein